MKNRLFLIPTILFATFLFVLNVFAQDYTRWHLPEGVKVRLGKGSINQIAYSPNDTMLAVATEIGIWLYDVSNTGKFSLLLPHITNIQSIAFSPDGKILASGSEDKIIRLWDVAIGTLKQTYIGHEAEIFDVAFSPTGRKLASASSREINLWDIGKGMHQQTFDRFTYHTSRMSFNTKGLILTSVNHDNTIQLSNIITGKPKVILKGHTKFVRTVSFSPDGNTFASTSIDGEIYLWDVNTGKHEKTLIGHQPIMTAPKTKALGFL